MRGALDDPDLVLKGLIGANVAGFVVGAMCGLFPFKFLQPCRQQVLVTLC